jgi:hypothetical protein
MKKRTMNVRKLLNSDEKRERFLQRCVYMGQEISPWTARPGPHVVEYHSESHIKRYRIYSQDNVSSIVLRRKKNGTMQHKGRETPVKQGAERQLVLMAAFPHYLGD